MKINFKVLLAAVLLTSATQSFANPLKPVHAVVADVEDRKVSDFNGINLSGSYDYYVKQGNTNAVRVEAPAKVLPYIITEVKNGVLNVYTKNHTNWGNLFKNEKIAVYITAKDINSIKLSGSGDVFFKEGINSTDMAVTLSGSGDVVGKINASSVECTLTGSGDLKISGRAENAKIKLTGSGDLSARELQTVNTYVELVGSGDVDVNVSGSLNAKLAGSGDIRYSGNPKSVSKSKSGSGSIERG